MQKMSDRTVLSCLAIVAIAGVLNVGQFVPPDNSPRLWVDWWDVACFFTPGAPWCPGPIPLDPPSLPKPEVEPPSQPCGSDDTCQ